MVDPPYDKEELAFLRRIAGRIVGRRRELQMSQSELSRRSGVSITTLNHIEWGKHAAIIVTYRKLAHALSLEMSQLFDKELT